MIDAALNLTNKLDRFPTVTLAGFTFHVDRYGFPVEECGRCGGSGHFSYCQRFGTTCFGCGGSGVAYAAKLPAVQQSEWAQANKAAGTTVGHKMQPGDRVRRWGATKATKDEPRYAWHVVASVELGEPCGWYKIGDGEQTACSWRATITFEDGEVVETGGENWVADARVDPAPYVERAQKAMVTKLRRRRSAGAR